MNVTLLNTPTLDIADMAIGKCYDKGCYNDDEKKKARLKRVAIKNNHSSTIEFINFQFEITANTKVLLEMTRHRHASYACRSTRYTLNKTALEFDTTGIDEIDAILENLRQDVLTMSSKYSNDIVSLLLPQAYMYSWVVEFNARSLRNFLKLRTDKSAHFSIRQVANLMYDTIPNDMKFLFEDVIYESN